MSTNRIMRDGLSSNHSNDGHGDVSSLTKAEGALRQVRKNCSPVMNLDFNPVPLALELLDNSSLGRDLVGFEKLLATLNTTVEDVVNDHYHQFSTTTANFTGVQMEINHSRSQVQDMRSDLVRCKEILTTQRSDLNLLWSKAKQYKEMLNILDQLDEIKLVPDRLESLFRDKYYLTGIRLLIATLKKLDTPTLAPIKATSEIRRSLTKLKTSLHEALIEEIHNHVYLKIHLNEEFDHLTGFSSMEKFQEMVAKYLDNEFDDSNLPVRSPRLPGETQERVELEEDLTSDPEADSLNFLRIVVISLKLIGKLPEALAMIKTRVPVELYQLVDKTINEVDALKEKGDPLNLKTPVVDSNQPLDPFSQETLDSFVGRLYQKFILVLGHHHFIGLLVNNISQTARGAMSPFPEDPPAIPNPTNLNRRVSWLKLNKEAQPPSYTVKEVWAAVQSEIRSILFDYITDPQLQNMGVADTISSINDSMKGKDVRDIRKQVFKFSATEGQPLYEKVRLRVGGSAGSDASKKLFSLTTQDSPFHIPDEGIPAVRRRQDASNSALTINLASIAVDKYSLSSNLSTEHRLLTSPDIYNIKVLFPHTVLFLERAQALLGGGSSQVPTEGFLQDFFASSFLPQMELKAQQHLKVATTGSHAFQISTKHMSSHGRPLLNCVGELISLVGNLCSTLQSLPFQREEYIRIIESVLEVFLEKCEGCFKGIIVNRQMDEDAGGAIVSSTWAQSPEILSLFATHPYMKHRANSFLNPKAVASNPDAYHQFGSYFSTESNQHVITQLNDKEMEIELQLKQKRSLHTSELLFDNKKLSLLAALSHSMKWFVAQVNQMIGTSQTGPASQSTIFDPLITSELAQAHKGSSIWSMAEITNHFDSLLEKFGNLADLCLLTLRIEFRCHTMYYLDLAVREGNYYISHRTAIHPDTYITTLNSDLAICEESLHHNLTQDDLRFVFDMLANFMSRVLISTDNVRNIGKMSQRGLDKMLLNIAALQQNLTSLEFFGDKGLAHAHSFYSLYDLDLETFADRAQDQGLLFSHSEYKSLLDLTLETLHFENTLSSDPAKKSNQNNKEELDNQEQQVTDLIIQSYHKQLMALREFTARYDE